MRVTEQLIFWTNFASAGAFLGLGIWLDVQADNSVFETWSDTVVLGGNKTMFNSIARTNSSLRGLCDRVSGAPPPSEHVVTQNLLGKLLLLSLLFSLNCSRVEGSVFCKASRTTYNSKTLLLLVLFVSFMFQLLCLVTTCEYAGRFHPGLSPLQRNYTDSPNFMRWLKYTLTSPLQVIVICSTIYMRNEQQLLLISALQGVLTLFETCIFHLQITVYQRGKWSQTFLDMMAKVTTVLLAAVYVHYVIWSVILSSYSAHEDNMRRCDYGIDKI